MIRDLDLLIRIGGLIIFTIIFPFAHLWKAHKKRKGKKDEDFK